MGLWGSGSHDPAEIACYLWVYDMRSGDTGDEAISESDKCINILSVDGSSVVVFSLKL